MSETRILDGAYSWARLALTLLITAVGSVGIWSYIAVLPAVQSEFGLGRGEASTAYVLTMTGFAVGNFVMGRAMDRFGAAGTQAIAAIILGAGYLMAACSPSYWAVASIHLLIGLGSAASFGPMMADISHWFMRRRGLAVTIVASGNYIAGAFWPWALSDVLAEDGWRQVYFVLAAAAFLIAAPLTLFLRRRAPASALAEAGAIAAANARSTGFSSRALTILLMIAGLACCTAMAMPQVHIVAYCVDLGYGPAVGAEMLSLMLIGGVISRIASGALADWLGGVKTLIIGSVLQCLALALYIPWDGLAPLYVVSAIFGLSQGGIVPAYAIIVREYMKPEEAGARVGIVIMATIFGMALGGWMSGWIYDLTGSYFWAFLNGIAWNLLNIAIALTLILRSRTSRNAAFA